MTVTVEVWERNPPGAPTKVADITEAWGRNFQVRKNDYGVGVLNVPLADPEQSELTPGRLVRFVRDGVTRQTIVLGPRIIKKVSRGEKSEQVLVVQRPGALEVLNDARVQPFAVGWHPWDRQRRWDFTNPAHAFTGATAAVELWQQGVSGDPSLTSSTVYGILFDQGRFPYNVPDGFVDGSAWWIWSSGYDGSPGTGDTGTLNMPVGTSYFHKTFTVAEETRARVIAGADDHLEVAIDGVVMFETGPAPEQAFARARERDVLLSAGTHTIRVRVENYTTLIGVGNIAGLVLSVHEVNGETNAAGDVLVRTDDSWSCLDYPADPPGFTVGDILLKHLAEWQAAGFLTDVDPTFSATLDSDGNAFPVVSDVVTSLGQLPGDLVKQLCQSHIDTRFNGDMTWDVWVKGEHGTSTTVEFEVGVNIGEMEFDGDQTPVSSLLLLHADGTVVLGDATSGRQEFLDLSSLPAEQAVEQGTAMLADLAEERWAVSITPEPAGGDVPFDDFDVLDLVTVPTPSDGTDLVECIAISWSEDDAGNDILVSELGDVVLTVAERRQQLLDRASLGALAGRSMVPASGGVGVVSSPSSQSGGGFPPLSPHQPIPPFERDPDVTETTSWPYRFQVSGSLFEVGVMFGIGDEQPGDVDVVVEIDGTPTATITVPAGERYATGGGLAVPVVKDITEMVVTCADTGFYLQVTPRVR